MHLTYISGKKKVWISPFFHGMWNAFALAGVFKSTAKSWKVLYSLLQWEKTSAKWLSSAWKVTSDLCFDLITTVINLTDCIWKSENAPAYHSGFFSWIFVSLRKHVASKMSAVKMIFCLKLLRIVHQKWSIIKDFLK